MEKITKIQIYKGMIQYLLESTSYTIKNIADLTNSSIKNIRSIYLGDQMPIYFPSEVQLIKLYQIVLEIQTKNRKLHKCSD